MKKLICLFIILFINSYGAYTQELLSSSLLPSLHEWQNPTYVFDSVNIMTGQYTEAQNDLHLSGPAPLSLRRYHTGEGCFLSGWQCNFPNLFNTSTPGEAGHFTSTHKISYEYDQQNRLKAVKASDFADEHLYSWLNIQHSDDPYKQCIIQTHDNQQITYRFRDPRLIAEVISSSAPSIAYHYQKHPSQEGYLISRRELPEGRYIEYEYYGKGHPHAGKVKVQKSPVGEDATAIVTRRFVYYGGYTEVYDALNCKTIYRFCDGYITDIENYDSAGQLFRLEKLIWTQASEKKKNSKQLRTRYIADAQGTILIAHSFSYDIHHRLIKETLYGNLTGTCTLAIQIGHDGYPLKNGIEHYSITYEYANDLLKSTEEDNGKKIIYAYFPNTPYLQSKLTCINNKIILREFYSYNQAWQVTTLSKDDGSSKNINDLTNVSERHIKTISYRTSHPALGLTESIEERALNLSTGQTHLIKKIIYHYNHQAKVIQEDYYDANNQHYYSINNTYDERQKLITSSDEVKGLTEKSYDLNGNLLKQTSISPTGIFQQIIHAYDFANRLISSEVSDNNNQTKKTYFHYDLKGNKRAFIDECGNQTTYEYDSLGRETRVIYPAVLDENFNVINPSKQTSYDVLNRVIAQTDAKGYTTYTQYNVYGKPILILYPDQRVEKFIYNLDGSLKVAFDIQGNYTVYHRDPLGRLFKNEAFDKTGALYKATTFIHNAFHLLEAREASDRRICYKYDYMGRLQALEQMTGKTISKRLTYEYNHLGQQTVSKEWYGPHLENFIATIKEYDFKNDLKSTRIEDAQGKIQKMTWVEPTPVQPSPLEELVFNSLGQQVLQEAVTDPSGNVTLTLYDAIKRPVKITKKNSLGDILFLQELQWDANNHKAKETYFLSHGKTISTVWHYDSYDRLIRCIEGFGTVRPMTTHYTYNEAGQLSALLKPDGVTIFYEYDSLGNLIALHSSDLTIHYILSYDSLQHITHIEDKVHSLSTRRTFSLDGCLLEEVQGNGLKTTRHYDELNRCIQLDLPDTSSIKYSYDSLYLRKIERQRLLKDPLIHKYQERNLNGHPLISDLAGGIGQELRSYNSKGYLTHISTPFWSEAIHYLPEKPQIIESITFKDLTGEHKHNFIYDDQNYLTNEAGLFSNTYTYNWLGNQTSKNYEECTINPLGQLIGYHNTQNDYDANGNLKEKMTKGNRLCFEYDALNRMIALRQDNGEVYRYTYDLFHRRLSKTCFAPNGEKKWEQKYLYDGLNEIGAVNDKNQITELRVLGEGLGAEIGSAVLLEIEDQAYVPLHDHRGSVCGLISLADQTVREQAHYSAFGEEERGNPSCNNPWRFSSKRMDPESGLIYFGKRYYDPSLGQWTTQDPLGPMESPNLYAFASNNPINRMDPYGLFSFSNLWSAIYSQVTDIGQQIFSLLRNMHAFMSTHLSLEHNFNEKIEGTASAIFGKLTLGICGFYIGKNEAGVIGQGEINDKVRITLINGILNARHDVIYSLEIISKFHGGNNIHYIFRPTEGWTYDFLKSLAVRCGWVSPQAKQLASKWRELIAQIGGVEGGGRIIHYAHSIGASDTLRAKGLLSAEELNMIDVYTFGSPCLLAAGGFQNVINYVSLGDAVCYLDPITYIKSFLDPQKHITFLPSSWGLPLIDHQLGFPTYRKLLEALGKEFLEIYRAR
jgi:RHS repeat-associated protein